MYVIGIAGGTCSGKTTLSEILAKRLSDNFSVAVLHMDGFFKKNPPDTAAPFTGKIYPDHNHPDSFRLDDFYARFDEIVRSDADVVIVEGLLILYLERIRRRLNLKIFVDLRSDERLVRRVKKFGKERGQSFEEVTERFLDTVRYRHDEFVEPTRWHADVVINGVFDDDRGVEIIESYVKDAIDN